MLTVKKSNIPNSGNGLFATTDIKKDDTIAEFEGDILTPDEVDELSDIEKYYLVDVDGYLSLFSRGCHAAYANDAEGLGDSGYKNNSFIEMDDDNRAYLTALRDIKSGEEIFTSYGDEYWDTFTYNKNLEKEEENEYNYNDDSTSENIITKFSLFESNKEYIHKMDFNDDGVEITWKDDIERIQDIKSQLDNLKDTISLYISRPGPGSGIILNQLYQKKRLLSDELQTYRDKGFNIDDDNTEFANPHDAVQEKPAPKKVANVIRRPARRY